MFCKRNYSYSSGKSRILVADSMARVVAEICLSRSMRLHFEVVLRPPKKVFVVVTVDDEVVSANGEWLELGGAAGDSIFHTTDDDDGGGDDDDGVDGDDDEESLLR